MSFLCFRTFLLSATIEPRHAQSFRTLAQVTRPRRRAAPRPLALSRGRATGAADDGRVPDHRRAVTSPRGQVGRDRLIRLVNGLLVMARADAGYDLVDVLIRSQAKRG